jgi:hypothetical protein
MSLLPEIRQELYAAAERQVEGREAAPRRQRWRDSISMAVAVALVVVVVGGVAAVLLSVHRGTGANAVEGHGGASTEQPLLRILGVLRRPQTKADLPPALVSLLKRGSRFRPVWLGIPDLRGVRLAAVTPAGEQVFLVPYRPPSPAAIATAIAHAFPGSRSRWATLVRRQVRAQFPHGDRLAIQLMSHGRPGSGGSATAATIKRGGVTTWGGFYAPRHSTEVIVVVPDGVAKVVLAVPTAKGRAILATVTGRVHNNVLAVLVPGAQEAPIHNMAWYAPSGEVIRSFRPNNAGPSTNQAGIQARQNERRAQLLHIYSRYHYHAPPALLAAFSVFSITSRIGMRTPSGLIISWPSLTSLAYAVVNDADPRQPAQLDTGQIRQITTPTGLSAWVIPGRRGICIIGISPSSGKVPGVTGGGGEGCDSNLTRAERSGTGFSSGGAAHVPMIYEILPKSKPTFTIPTGPNRGKTVRPLYGIYIARG